MGFALNLGGILQNIEQIYSIDSQIRQLVNSKYAIAQAARRAGGAGQNSGNQGSNPMQEALANQEKEIDKQLEMLRALRQAMETQKQEYQKNVSVNIKNTFSNPYQG